MVIMQLDLEVEEEISEYLWNPQEQFQHEEAGEEQAEDGAKRGAKLVPEQWTRVISIFTDNLESLKVCQTSTDLLVLAGYQYKEEGVGD